MIRRRHGISLSRTVTEEEDINPNSYIVNIADCMLVLLLGVIVALISYYNIDLAKAEEHVDELTGIEVNLDQNQDGVIDAGYTQRGTVYYDEVNDKYYYVAGGGA